MSDTIRKAPLFLFVRTVALVLIIVSLIFASSSVQAKKLFGSRSKSKEETTQSAEEKKAEAAPYKGLKKRIAVTDFEVKASSGFWHDAGWEIGDGMAEMLITALNDTGRFIVVERMALDDVLKEQDLGTAGRVNPETAAKVGRILGAQILVRGAVTEFEHSESGGLGGVRIKGIGIGLGGKKAHVGLDIRLIDSTTGRILESHRAEGKASTKGFALAGYHKGIGFGGAGFKKTPLGKATRLVIEDAVEFIVENMEGIPWTGRIVKVDRKRIIINAGENMGIKVGDKFDVYRAGEELVDPESGLSLGTEEEKMGKIKVTSVQEKFSIVSPLEGENFQRNDILRQ